MLQLSGTFLNQAVMSLRTGAPVATASEPIINPNNLKIEGWYCHDRFSKEQLILLSQDVREVLPQGFVVNDHDVLSPASDLVRLQSLLKLKFFLIGKPVVTVDKQKVGKVTDFAVEVETFYIQKLYAGQSVLKSFSGGSLSIDRSQIVEITNRQVVIQELLKPTKTRVVTAPLAT